MTLHFTAPFILIWYVFNLIKSLFHANKTLKTPNLAMQRYENENDAINRKTTLKISSIEYQYIQTIKYLMMKLALSLTTILAVISATEGFSPLSRRESFAKVASSIVGGAGVIAASTTAVPNAAIAYPSEETPKVTTRMGGLLVSEKWKR